MIISWPASFSSRAGTVEAVAARRVTIRRESDGHRYTARIPDGLRVCVSPGETVAKNQIIASSVKPLRRTDISCSGILPEDRIESLLVSRERTQRFTGIKLARLRGDRGYADLISQLESDAEEDVYVRLEGASYLASSTMVSAREIFADYLEGPDQQTQLEAVIALGETISPSAIALLCEILDDQQRAYFLRSAAAWSLSRAVSHEATTRLVQAFSDIDPRIREEALEGIVSMGEAAFPLLASRLGEADHDIAAGCAEALRQQGPSLPKEIVRRLSSKLQKESPSPWTVWLLGHLPKEHMAASIANLQNSAPELQFALSLLWAFAGSWIARRWELNPRTNFPRPQESDSNAS